jgi:hypothetical protein
MEFGTHAMRWKHAGSREGFALNRDQHLPAGLARCAPDYLAVRQHRPDTSAAAFDAVDFAGDAIQIAYLHRLLLFAMKASKEHHLMHLRVHA